jgi:plastocyanin
MPRLAFAPVVAAAAALAVVPTATSRSSVPTLKGSVGPGYTISLTQNGKRVTSLKAGSYTIVVSDKASIHNFVLEKSHGGSFEKQITSVPFKGTKSVKVRLTKGDWEYYCRPHESMMHADFTVK